MPAPCVGIGPGPQLERKCLDAYTKEGFLPADSVGHSGMTLSLSRLRDGVIESVQPGSPAQAAGLMIGDSVIKVDGRSVVPTPGDIVTREIFGARGQMVVLKVRHGADDRTVQLTRAPANAPNPPKVAGFLIATKPLIDWRGKYIPCTGAPGPAGVSGFALCSSLFERYGYIRVADLGSTGIVLDLSPTDAAHVASVEPGSPAATAGILPGDLVSAGGDGDQSPVGPITHKANNVLFGKIGDKHSVTVRRAGREQTAEIFLVPGPR